MALIDLKGHYLDLIVTALEVGGNACLHREAAGVPDKGLIYVTPSPKVTKSDFVVAYEFNSERVAIGIQFADERPALEFIAPYVKGLEGFWPQLRKALDANRLTVKA